MSKRTWQYEAVETILKGKEITLPPGAIFRDKLVAYCWDGEQQLESEKSVWVERVE